MIPKAININNSVTTSNSVVNEYPVKVEEVLFSVISMFLSMMISGIFSSGFPAPVAVMMLTLESCFSLMIIA